MVNNYPLSRGICPRALTVSPVLSISDGGVTELELGVHNVLDILVLQLLEFGHRGLLPVDLSPLLQKGLRSEERPQVLRPERGVAVQFAGHDSRVCSVFVGVSGRIQPS